MEPANTSVTAPITSDADVLGKLHQEMQKLAMVVFFCETFQKANGFYIVCRL